MARHAGVLNAPKALSVRPTPADVLRIMAQITETEDGCWLWTGRHCDDKGYGQAYFQGKMYWVHRLVYAMFRGAIKDGMTLDHWKCNTPPCCNPWHMTQKTLGENSARANRRRAKKAREDASEVPF